MGIKPPDKQTQIAVGIAVIIALVVGFYFGRFEGLNSTAGTYVGELDRVGNTISLILSRDGYAEFYLQGVRDMIKESATWQAEKDYIWVGKESDGRGWRFYRAGSESLVWKGCVLYKVE